MVDNFTPQHFRRIKDQIPRLKGGWHMSYIGGIQQIHRKFLTSCDVSNKQEVPSIEVLKERLITRLKEGQFNLRHNVDLPVYFIENPDIPNNITKEKYPTFFLQNLNSI